jgi:F-type H+-transporting ATPase subunit epsilon
VAYASFRVEVLTPDGEVFNDEVELVSTRTTVGSLGLRANHTPILAVLEPAELRLYRSESDVLTLAQAEGYMQMTGNHCLLLVEEAMPPEDLDRSALETRVQEADSELEQADDDSERAAKARRDKRRAELFLELASGGGSSSDQ